MQTIFGSGGVIGKELAKSLKKYTDKIRLVARNPQKINEGDELFPADLTNKDMLFKAVEGSSIVYVTIGLPYNVKTWEKNWPIFISNVIDACIKYNSKLVFFDNIYMYDKNFLGDMTEETPINPSSKKGVVRMNIAKMIMDAVEEGKLTALIARSADFYGPKIKNKVFLSIFT